MSFYFVAIPLPDQLKKELANIQHKFKSKLPYKQWTYIDDFHITLKFLGSVEHKKLFSLQKKLQQLHDLRAFDVKIGSIHTFGKRTCPRVLWTAVDKNNEILRLYNKVQSICEELGYRKEQRTFQPHITLGKKWSGQPKVNLINNLNKGVELEYILHVREVVLYEISPSRVPKYTVVFSFPLNGGEENRSINKT